MKNEKILKESYVNYLTCLSASVDSMKATLNEVENLPEKSFEELNEEDKKSLLSFSQLVSETAGKLLSTGLLLLWAIIEN